MIDFASTEYPPMQLPCGGQAWLDRESSFYAYRCENCLTVVGSIGQPKACREAANKWAAWESLGGKGWDYVMGKPKCC